MTMRRRTVVILAILANVGALSAQMSEAENLCATRKYGECITNSPLHGRVSAWEIHRMCKEQMPEFRKACAVPIRPRTPQPHHVNCTCLQCNTARQVRGLNESLLSAASKGDAAGVRHVLASGAGKVEINARGLEWRSTALVLAALRGERRFIRCKCLLGSPVDCPLLLGAPKPYRPSADEAAYRETERILLEQGADCAVENDIGLSYDRLISLKQAGLLRYALDVDEHLEGTRNAHARYNSRLIEPDERHWTEAWRLVQEAKSKAGALRELLDDVFRKTYTTHGRIY